MELSPWAGWEEGDDILASKLQSIWQVVKGKEHSKQRQWNEQNFGSEKNILGREGGKKTIVAKSISGVVDLYYGARWEQAWVKKAG